MNAHAQRIEADEIASNNAKFPVNGSVDASNQNDAPLNGDDLNDDIKFIAQRFSPGNPFTEASGEIELPKGTPVVDFTALKKPSPKKQKLVSDLAEAQARLEQLLAREAIFNKLYTLKIKYETKREELRKGIWLSNIPLLPGKPKIEELKAQLEKNNAHEYCVTRRFENLNFKTQDQDEIDTLINKTIPALKRKLNPLNFNSSAVIGVTATVGVKILATSALVGTLGFMAAPVVAASVAFGASYAFNKTKENTAEENFKNAARNAATAAITSGLTLGAFGFASEVLDYFDINLGETFSKVAQNIKGFVSSTDTLDANAATVEAAPAPAPQQVAKADLVNLEVFFEPEAPAPEKEARIHPKLAGLDLPPMTEAPSVSAGEEIKVASANDNTVNSIEIYWEEIKQPIEPPVRKPDFATVAAVSEPVTAPAPEPVAPPVETTVAEAPKTEEPVIKTPVNDGGLSDKLAQAANPTSGCAAASITYNGEAGGTWEMAKQIKETLGLHGNVTYQIMQAIEATNPDVNPKDMHAGTKLSLDHPYLQNLLSSNPAPKFCPA